MTYDAVQDAETQDAAHSNERIVFSRGSAWSAETTSALENFLKQGLTYAVISEKLGKMFVDRSFTRNSVAGRALRLNTDAATQAAGGSAQAATGRHAWNLTLISKLTELFERGLSMNECATAIHADTGLLFSVGAVKSKAAKLGLKRKRSPRYARKSEYVRKTDYVRAQTARIPVEEEAYVMSERSSPVFLLNLGAGMCRYVIDGVGKSSEFCANDVTQDASWCSYHQRIVNVSPESYRRDVDIRTKRQLALIRERNKTKALVLG